MIIKCTPLAVFVMFQLLCFSAFAENTLQPSGEQSAQAGEGALQEQVEALLKRIDELEAKKTKVLELSEKEVVTTGSPLALRLSGHLNRAVVWHSNGKNSNTVHADVDNSPSRLNVTAVGNLSEQTKIFAVIEEAFEPNSTDRIDVHDANDNQPLTHRKVEVYIDDKKWGRLFVGQGSTASDGTMEDVDMSGTNVVSAGSSISFAGAGIQFFDRTTNAKALLNGQRMIVETVFDSGDGLFRRNRIRYDTPEFYGLRLQASHYYKGRNDNRDVAFKYAGTANGIKIGAQGAYLRRLSKTVSVPGGSTPAKYHQFNGSLGVLFTNGISIFLSALHRDWKSGSTRNGSIYFAKLGYQHSFVEAGKTAFAVDYGEYKNLIFDTRPENERDQYKGTSYGVMLTQFLDRIATELFVAGRLYRLDGPSRQPARYKDAKLVLSGMRVKF